ncbi:nuclear transport factor 2 family protein [Pseudoalteromonas sp.]|uniref:nuclear transport factor 2 family protein n=1 Tax=Pseudoalteromonas sp. TaxID=53249 RepID=UPI00356B4F09
MYKLHQRAFILFGLIGFLLSGCAASTMHKQTRLQETVADYYDTYSKRTDFQNFMAFYDENAQLNDIIYGNSLNNKKDITAFFAWDNGQFEVLEGKPVLTISKQVIDGNTVITEGHFNQFKYNQQVLGPWLFIMVHQFNDKNKIIKQTDWINYTPRNQFLGGKSMNQRLLEK